MAGKPYGRVLSGDEDQLRRKYDAWVRQPVDQEMPGNGEDYPEEQTTLAAPFEVTGPGTFLGGAQRTLRFEPAPNDGWWFDRTDLPESLPIGVSVKNVWTTARNIVLRSGSPHNYMRMVEHVVALKVGMGLDNVVISMDSGDPPLFDRSSLDMVEAVERAGIVGTGWPAPYVTVKEPVSVVASNGSFLVFLPAEGGSHRLEVDCAIDFRSAIGKQRIRFRSTGSAFRHAALARTNTTLAKMIYCKTIGKVFADVRNLGYTTKNILVAGPRRYFNKPGLVHEGRSLEAVWHRAALDLLAAVALIDRGRFAGTIISYKAGHALDVQMVQLLYRHHLLETV